MSAPAPRARAPRDPGRQPERTALSWLRTMLVATVVALLASRSAVLPSPTPARLVVVAVVFGLWGAVLLAGWRRTAAMTVAAPGSMRWTAPLVTFVALSFATVGVVLVTLR
jgi:hypothetical protein